MTIDIKDLLGSVQAIRSPGARIGLPDDPAPVDVVDSPQLISCMDNALSAFGLLRGGCDYLVCAEINTYHRQIGIRFVQRGPSQDRNGEVEPALVPSFRALRAAVAKNHGKLDYWGGNNYFDLCLPFCGPMREFMPEVEHLPWDERYRYWLERETWESLRTKVFRFSSLAESFAVRCAAFGLSRVLIPSVGLCVHPWLLADRKLSVVATDASAVALTALSEPDRWPRLYSRAAYERWDIAESASYATQGNPDHFESMPDLEDQGIRELLRPRITFAQGDWTELALGGESVDAIFATNALPRESSAERLQVLKEWVRVVRPGGFVFIAQHNFFDSDVETVVRRAGWVGVDVLGGERPAQSNATGFQIYYSSG